MRPLTNKPSPYDFQCSRFDDELEADGFGAYDHGDEYLQSLEPDGTYVHVTPTGNSHTLQRPLHLDYGGPADDGEEGDNWKAVLWRHYKLKKAALTSQLQAEGYDGIVTWVSDQPAEVVIF